MSSGQIKALHYITHVENLPSILTDGILSHSEVEKRGVQVKRIYDAEIVSHRKEKRVPDGRSLWDFANLYFNARNPMLYRVKAEHDPKQIAVLQVNPGILNRDDIFITNGNAANTVTEILPAAEGKRRIREIRAQFEIEYWNTESGSKRKIMAECLVPTLVPAEYISAIYVIDHETATTVKRSLRNFQVEVIPEPRLFFEPDVKAQLTSHLKLVVGDMFFSRLHTMTVSVNTVGVMGKGLASRAKYQFPDVYVYYQDACRNRSLKMGVPVLYKRERSFDHELADEPSSLTSPNGESWFLLFATKKHWRDRGDLEAISKGLEWIERNYRSEGIRSLALPALGCGLGWLSWADVGPLICSKMSNLDIDVWVYLPAEKEIPKDQLTERFLLKTD